LSNPYVWVSDVGQVTAQWSAATDADGHAISYQLYRDVKPITAASIGVSPTMQLVIDNYTGTAYTCAASASEIAQSYVWYYAVRAKATVSPGVFEYSLPSKSAAPNMHGYAADTDNTIGCERCHSVHGAGGTADFRDKSLCYTCHAGATSSSPGARSTINVKADFLSYADQTAGSRHTMANDSQRCSACHSPHRSPWYYDLAGAYQSSNSFRMAIRVQTGISALGKPTYTYTSRNDDLAENTSSCLLCHGASSTNIGYVGVAGVYATTGGDHNASGYTTAAHGPAVVLSNDTDTSKPQVQCLACHDNHASTLDKLIAYRKDDSGLTSSADLCYACHSSSTSEARAVGSAPYSWNGRDVEDEFATSTSKHPTTYSASGRSLTCMNCHNVHYVQSGSSSAWQVARASDPDNTKNTPTSTTAFCLGCHDGTAPASQVDTSTLIPYSAGFSATTAWPYFPGWNKSAASLSFTTSGHYTTAGQSALCENCHDPHASDFPRLTAWTRPTSASSLNAGERANSTASLSREENLCYQCHGNGTIGKQATGAKNVATAASSTYAHPISATGVHTDTETSANFAYASSNSKRHSECVDCHDPHATRQVGGSALHVVGTSTAGGALLGAWGVNPNYGASSNASNWTVPSAATFTNVRLTGTATDYEAYLCLKCHSNNTTLNTAVYTNQALEFNPSNYSDHNVLGQSTGMESSFQVDPIGAEPLRVVSWPIPTVNVFKAGYNANSKMTCTDCHTNSTADAKGPHGSSVEWMLDPDYPADWQTAGLDPASTVGISYYDGAVREGDGEVICSKCHDLYNGGTWSNDAHKGPTGGMANQHYITNVRRKYCIDCHIPVPHGWKRPRLLGYTTDAAPYTTTGLQRVNAQSITISAGFVNWDCASCKSDNGGVHSSEPAYPWP
jgi:predicted CXXCH cytochrome family protein